MSDDFDGEPFDDESFDEDFEDAPLDVFESEMVQQDLEDLDDFEAVFTDEGYKGVSVFCRDCVEDHFYPWDMLRENLAALLATGETPVHEPAFQPEPAQYVPWEYAHGYVDALRESGAFERRQIGQCPRCDLHLADDLAGANYCPRCGHQMLGTRLRLALTDRLSHEDIDAVLREVGLPD